MHEGEKKETTLRKEDRPYESPGTASAEVALPGGY